MIELLLKPAPDGSPSPYARDLSVFALLIKVDLVRRGVVLVKVASLLKLSEHLRL